MKEIQREQVLVVSGGSQDTSFNSDEATVLAGICLGGAIGYFLCSNCIPFIGASVGTIVGGYIGSKINFESGHS